MAAMLMTRLLDVRIGHVFVFRDDYIKGVPVTSTAFTFSCEGLLRGGP